MNDDKRKQAVQWIATWMGDHDVVLCERAYAELLDHIAASTAHTESVAPEASQQLAETVLSMQMTTDKGLVARRLARQVLGIDEQGRGPDLVPITTNGTTRLIPRDEPVFLIRGQDAAGAATVRAWADMADALGADSEILRVAREHADKMDVWPKKKTADLPQGSPSPSPAPSPASDAHERSAFEAAFRAANEFPEQADQVMFRKGWEAARMWERQAHSAAPQAVALTDEQIKAEWFKVAGHIIASGRLLEDAKCFARALLDGSRECSKQWQSWQAAERDALERAAKVCRERAKKQPNLDMKFVAIDCERDIRALAGKE